MEDTSGHVEEITGYSENISVKGQVGDCKISPTQPDNDELNTESVSGLLAVVLNDLWREDNDPAGNRDRSQDSADGLDVEAVAH